MSRAGNHFSFNRIHSQVRNVLAADPHEFDFEYFYVSFVAYDPEAADRRAQIDVVNEKERRTKETRGGGRPPGARGGLLKPHKGVGYLFPAPPPPPNALATPGRPLDG